ncbi:arsenate reductase ArsC [Candidatus Manganitrophus noduliformans]|uniref:Arsenate reductase ArsC n=1 Tax=Candidatus Manganitrophus noduliformans TaxID=2606439 RepID=A0A7X6IAA6_9BACT|nr:arsenate reductase ArsC [Candidatus Manganitrophus noduliformans]NKE70296.1 arsenate reductase ArsC [Candidatus Manganitrophus noduliformans]
MTRSERKRILFVCTHNSARSQMAEGWVNFLYCDRYEAFSAGTAPSRVDPRAIQIMAEVGINLSQHRSKNLDEFQGMKFDYVVTVCDRAKGVCPSFPGGKVILHQSFDDPAPSTGAESLSDFRRIRDEIKKWLEGMFG